MNTFRKTFDDAKIYDKYAGYVLLLSSLTVVSSFVLQNIDENFQVCSELIINFNCLLIFLYLILQFTSDYIFYEASVKKRIDFIDNSFGTKFSEINLDNYYSNDEVSNGILKMAVNGFENSLFTYHIAKSMQKELWIKSVLIGILFIFVGVSGYNSAFVMLFHLSLPIFLFFRALRLSLFVSRVENVFGNYRKLFTGLDLKKTKSFEQNKFPEILLSILEYETILSWGNILLDTKVYNKMNSELSQQWEELKQRYGIQ